MAGGGVVEGRPHVPGWRSVWIDGCGWKGHRRRLADGRGWRHAHIKGGDDAASGQFHLMDVAVRETALGIARIVFSWLRVSGTTEMPQVDERVCHQLHAIVMLLDKLEPQQQPFEFILPREGPLHA